MEETQRKALYTQLKTILAEYADLFTVYDNPGKYSLYTKKHISMDGKPPDEQYFAGLRELKNIVGFYFMPVYTVPELREQVPASFQKNLKGNACFNFKALTPEMIADL